MAWSSGARLTDSNAAAPDLFAVAPGGQVQVIYDNPNRDSQLKPIVGDGAEFAFIEENFELFGYGGWKLWLVRAPGDDAELIDEGRMDVLPYAAISGNWLAWTPGPDDQSELVVLDLSTMQRRVIASHPVSKIQYWYPALSGSRLVYATIEQLSSGGDERHVYITDLSSAEPPRRLDTVHSATEPAIHGDDVVWKESDPSLNFVVSGSITHWSRQTGNSEPLLFRPGVQPTANGYGAGFMFPTAGDEFAAAWTDGFDGDRVLYLSELASGQPFKVVDLGPAESDPHDVLVRPVIKGSLLAYVRGPAAGDLELHWIEFAR